jgi:hypothetical protein
MIIWLQSDVINADNVTLLSMNAQYVETFIVYVLGGCNFTAIKTQ